MLFGPRPCRGVHQGDLAQPRRCPWHGRPRRFAAAVRIAAVAGVLGLVSGLGLAGCAESPDAQRVVRLSTTTSVAQCGLLSLLVDRFEQNNGWVVEVEVTGSGRALERARNGDADIVLVHSRTDEDRFIADGFGINRRRIMYNEFVVVGPEADPAGISSAPRVTDAFIRIAEVGVPFLSRGDASGTHARERELWALAGLAPGGAWYRSSGLGMAETLHQVFSAGAYTLTDRGTFLHSDPPAGVTVLFEGDARLLNIYSAIAVNPERVSSVDFAAAMAFIDYLVSGDAQDLIAGFGLQRFGQPLFVPAARGQQ